MPVTTPAAAVQIPAAGIYQLDPAASTVTFATRHMFGLASVQGTFRLDSHQITIAYPATSSTVSAVLATSRSAPGQLTHTPQLPSHINHHHTHYHPLNSPPTH